MSEPASEAKRNFYQVTPFMHVSNMREAVRFFTDRLGFRVTFQVDYYAYVERETVAFRMLLNEKKPGLGDRRILYYIDVADVDAVVAEIGPKLADLPEHHVFGPVDQEYGQREYMVRLPDGMVLCYGAATKTRAQ